MGSAPSTLRTVRSLHLYFGTFIAPALLFFAFTGALQTFGLHESGRGSSSYTPPRWAVVLGQLHKKQTVIVPRRRPSTPAATQAGRTLPGDPARAVPPGRHRHPVPLRIFFLLVCLGLTSSTITGAWLAYRHTRRPRLITGLLLLGAILPVILVFV